jgi:hypothetical protein
MHEVPSIPNMHKRDLLRRSKPWNWQKSPAQRVWYLEIMPQSLVWTWTFLDCKWEEKSRSCWEWGLSCQYDTDWYSCSLPRNYRHCHHSTVCWHVGEFCLYVFKKQDEQRVENSRQTASLNSLPRFLEEREQHLPQAKWTFSAQT